MPPVTAAAPAPAYDPALGPPLAESDATEVTAGAPKWRIVAYPDRLRFVPPDGSLPHDVFQAEADEKLELIDALIVPRVLTAKLDRKVQLRLPRPGYTKVERWFGRDRLLRIYLKRRLAWLPLLAMLFILSALPWRAGGDGPDKPLDPVGLGFGIGFAVLWVLWRTRPRPWLFLFDAAMFLALTVLLGHRLILNWSWIAFAFLLLLVSLFVGGIRLFNKFRDAPPAGDDQPVRP